MALPLAAPAARAVATWAGRATPEVIEVVAREVTTRSGVLVKTAQQLIAFANSSPVKASVVVAAAAAAGHDLYEGAKALFKGREGKDDGDYVPEVSALVDKNAHLELALGDAEDVRLAQDLVAFMRSSFAVRSPDELVRLHLMLRAFMELSGAQVAYISKTFWNNGRR